MQHSLSQTKNGVEQSVGLRAAKGSSVMGARIIELAAYRAQRLESEVSAAHESKAKEF